MEPVVKCDFYKSTVDEILNPWLYGSLRALASFIAEPTETLKYFEQN